MDLIIVVRDLEKQITIDQSDDNLMGLIYIYWVI